LGDRGPWSCTAAPTASWPAVKTDWYPMRWPGQLTRGAGFPPPYADPAPVSARHFADEYAGGFAGAIRAMRRPARNRPAPAVAARQPPYPAAPWLATARIWLR